MTCAMICHNNLAEESLINEFLFSSEQTLFPAENVLANKRAYKTWRSNGYFKVTSSNNQIVFKEGILASDVIATIAVGEYTTRAAFLLAVADALTAAGDNTYTATVDSNLMTVITSDLSTNFYFGLIGDSVDFTALDLLGYSAIEYGGSDSYTAEQIVLHTMEFLEFDLGVATEVQAAILLGRCDQEFGLSSNAQITLKINETASWDSPEYSEALTWNEFGVYTLDADGVFPIRRRVRIEIVDPQNPNGYIELASVFVGTLQEFERASPQFGFNDTVQDLTAVLDLMGGSLIGDRRPRYSEIQYNLNFLTNQDKEDLQDIYERFGLIRPLFFIFDENETLGTEAERMVRLMRFTGPLSFTKESARIWTVGMRLREEL
jgi:hypothetical protein